MITVADLDEATEFFVGLGLEVEGRASMEGEFLDTVCGIPNSRTEVVMLMSPDGGGRIELGRFVRPDHVPGSPDAMANELGLRNICFEVEDLQGAVDGLAKDGYGLVGGIGEWKNTWKMAYVRGTGGNRRRADRADRLTPRGCRQPSTAVRQPKSSRPRAVRAGTRGPGRASAR